MLAVAFHINCRREHDVGGPLLMLFWRGCLACCMEVVKPMCLLQEKVHEEHLAEFIMIHFALEDPNR